MSHRCFTDSLKNTFVSAVGRNSHSFNSLNLFINGSMKNIIFPNYHLNLIKQWNVPYCRIRTFHFNKDIFKNTGVHFLKTYSTQNACRTNFGYRNKEAIQWLKKSIRNSKNAPFVSLALLSLPLGFLLVNWDLVKKRVGKQGADVVQESIKSKHLQSTAVTVSKLLLQELLQDEDLIQWTAKWVAQIARTSKKELLNILWDYFNSQEFWVLLYTLSERLITNLCNSLSIQQETAKLLIASLKRDEVKEAVFHWLSEFLQSEQVIKQAEILIDKVSRNSAVQNSTVQLSNHIVEEVLKDSSTLEASCEHVLNVVQMESVQNLLSSTFRSILKKALVPQWSTLLTSTVEPKPSNQNLTIDKSHNNNNSGIS
ncbi:uncharacterized protein LOC128883326 [Hylaeus volcanicus]|uniref:uncharacterized protein LOC128883326 n=1 Tax=Hylaeus volcanicus TaxID=313075 RepID=UPI0023B84E5F|nr:uncharacterized protein LOC128883326 [Hylaeus volcanicus]